ncbi:MAG: rod shape-determining protein [Lachnospiraceae bacterium]|jgi:rod shape-determining protein MreB|nr:rod shape-determining protein [Lachnospiraceae bacterium]MCI1329188.1 rod shape-determining protein [Lachnospiraceae bacterium]
MLLHHGYGIDIGTSTVKIYDQKSDRIQKERNMIAILNNESVYAVGNEAYHLYGKTPENMDVITPMANGRISDVALMEAVLHTLLERCDTRIGQSPALYFSVLPDMTEIERRAYHTIAHRGNLSRSRIYMVERPIADALSFGIPVNQTNGTMIVNIGAQSTEISVIADAHVVISHLLPVGGHSINDAIVAAVRRRNHFLISDKSAKRLKLSLTDLSGGKMEARKVFGIDTKSGLPRQGIVTTYTVTSAVLTQVQRITDEIGKFLKRIPPQIRDNVNREGIYICGGSTRITGLPKFLNDNLDCAVIISGHYDLCTIMGIKEVILRPEYSDLAVQQ